MEVRAVLFDLDGTLADTAGEIALALEHAFAGFGLPALPETEVRRLIGRGVVPLVERALERTGATVDLGAAVARFEAAYEDTVGTSATLYPTVEDALERLAAAGLPLGLVTNKPREFTLRLLDRLAVTDRFAAVVCGDAGWPRKPAADMLLAACRTLATAPPATLMVGDSTNDVRAARAAGCPVWCVPYGYNEGRPVETLGADRIVASLGEAARRLLGVNPVDLAP